MHRRFQQLGPFLAHRLQGLYSLCDDDPLFPDTDRAPTSCSPGRVRSAKERFPLADQIAFRILETRNHPKDQLRLKRLHAQPHLVEADKLEISPSFYLSNMFVKSSYADFCKSAVVGVISCALFTQEDGGGPSHLEPGQQAFDGTIGVGLLSSLHKPSSALDAAELLLG